MQRLKRLQDNRTSCCAKMDGVAVYSNNEKVRFFYCRNPKQAQTTVFEDDKLTPKQWYLYRLAVYGLGTIPAEKRKSMSNSALRRARVTFVRAQKEINRLKNEILECKISCICKMFHHSQTATILKEDCRSEYDNFRNEMPFSFLRITEEMIIKRLVEVKILNRLDFQHLFPSQDPVVQQVLVSSAKEQVRVQ